MAKIYVYSILKIPKGNDLMWKFNKSDKERKIVRKNIYAYKKI